MGMLTDVFMLLIVVKGGKKMKQNGCMWAHKYESIKCCKHMKCSLSDLQIMKLVPDLAITE